jgi:hypothetical protein
VKNALRRQLELESYQNPNTQKLFAKAMVKHALYYGAIMYLYQKHEEVLGQYGFKLNKHAPARLTDKAVSYLRQVMVRTKAWYVDESNDLNDEVPLGRLESFIRHDLCDATGLDSNGPMPFTDNRKDWSQVFEVEEAETE